jgi:HAD superfamily hydrolase (TIGR01484 family)
MHFVALATDYDGTLAEESVTAVSTVDALERLKGSGRRLVMVTGRPLPDLLRIFRRVDLFDRVVAENGGLLYDPATGVERVLAAAPVPAFVERLKARGVLDLAVGKSVIGTWAPYHQMVLETIAEMNLGSGLDVILNTDAVMILARGTHKASGLRHALDELGLEPAAVVGVGDAENDQVLLEACGCGVAVANALPALKQVAHMVTAGARGAGVEEVIDLMLHQEHELELLAKKRTLVRASRERAPQ